MATLFGRKVRLTLADPKMIGGKERIDPRGMLIEDLRVSFRIHKTLKKEPNTAEVSVFNLSENSRAALQKRHVAIILEAGYDGAIAQLYSGDSRFIDQVSEGPDWVTKIQCGSGERAYQYRRVAKAFKRGTSVKLVVSQVAEALGFPTRGLEHLESLTEQFVNGYAAFGKVANELDHLLRSRGFEWSIQDGELQILPVGVATKETAVLLSAETGMIGSPEHGNPEKKIPAAQVDPSAEGFNLAATKVTGPAVLKVKSLIQPGLSPGRRVEVRARGIHGQFRIQSVEHVGDTHGQSDPGISTIECVPV
jgi:hypothetical protein